MEDIEQATDQASGEQNENREKESDALLAEVLHFIDERRQNLLDYDSAQLVLLRDIEAKEREIANLQKERQALNNRHKNKAFHLFQRLNNQTADLTFLQEKLFTAKKEIADLEEKMRGKEELKGKIASEINWLELEYDHLEGGLKKNEAKQAAKAEALSSLEQAGAAEAEVNRLREEVQELESEHHLIKHKKDEIYPTLVKKREDVIAYDRENEEIQHLIHSKVGDLQQIEGKILKKTHQLIKHQDQFQRLAEEFEREKQEVRNYGIAINQERKNLARLLGQLMGASEKFKQDMKAYTIEVEGYRKHL